MGAPAVPKYAMTRVQSGDYLLPSDDARILWRLYSYGEGWNLWRWSGAFPTLDSLNAAFEMDDWSMWDHWAGPFATRREALQEAVRCG